MGGSNDPPPFFIKNWNELTENILHFSALAATALKDGDTQTQREILSSLGSNHELKAKELFIDLHSWFSVLKKGEKDLLPEIKRFELDKTLDTQGRNEAFDLIRPKLWAGQDSRLPSQVTFDLISFDNESPFESCTQDTQVSCSGCNRN